MGGGAPTSARGARWRPLPDAGRGLARLGPADPLGAPWWPGRDLALAIDPPVHADPVGSLAASRLARDRAIPLALVDPAGQASGGPGGGRIHWELPLRMHGVGMADRGRGPPRLGRRMRDGGWHPRRRLPLTSTCQPIGQRCRPVRSLGPGPGHAWVGKTTVCEDRTRRRCGTLIVVWAAGEPEPWVRRSKVAPEKVGGWWDSLRVWVLASGTRAAEAACAARPSARLQAAPTPLLGPRQTQPRPVRPRWTRLTGRGEQRQRSARASPLAGPRTVAGPIPERTNHLAYVRPSLCSIYLPL